MGYDVIVVRSFGQGRLSFAMFGCYVDCRSNKNNDDFDDDYSTCSNDDD